MMFHNRKEDLVFYIKKDELELKPSRDAIFYGIRMKDKSGFKGFHKDGAYYEFNQYGWRCDEFTINHKNKYHILYAGCSETMGQGDAVEKSWPYILNEKINTVKTVSGFYSLGGAGLGWQDIINNIREYISKFGKPNAVIILFPDICRHIRWWPSNEEKTQGRFYEFMTTDISMAHTVEPVDIHLDIEMEQNFYINFVLTMQLFEDFCDSNGIDLIWSTWDDIFRDIINRNQIKFKYYKPLMWQSKEVAAYIDIDSTLTVIKDDGHRGSAVHHVWADKFYERWKAMINGSPRL